jgi:hypothetical protein
MKRYSILLTIGFIIAGSNALAENGAPAGIDSAIRSATEGGKKVIVLFYNPFSCIKCQLIIKEALREVKSFAHEFEYILILESSREVVAKNMIEKMNSKFDCLMLPDDGTYREMLKLPRGEPVWALFTKSLTIDRWGRFEGNGLSRLRDSILKASNTTISIKKISSVPIQENERDPLAGPRINSTNRKYIAVSDRSMNHGFLIDRESGEIAYQLSAQKESVSDLLETVESIYEGSLQNIVHDPIQIRHLHILDDTTLLILATVNVMKRRYSYERSGLVNMIYGMSIYGYHNTKTGRSVYKRVPGPDNLFTGYSSVVTDSMLFVGTSSGLLFRGSVSEYGKFRMLAKINLHTGAAVTLMEADSVYIENDLRGSYMISYLTKQRGKIYATSSLSDEIHEVGTGKSLRLEQNPFISSRNLFKSLNSGKCVVPQDNPESYKRINAVPLKCQIEDLTSLNDSMLAVAFTVSEGDLRNRSDPYRYYLQIINTRTGTCMGTPYLPIVYSKGEALTSIIGGGEGSDLFIVVVKTPENYRMDTYVMTEYSGVHSGKTGFNSSNQ